MLKSNFSFNKNLLTLLYYFEPTKFDLIKIIIDLAIQKLYQLKFVNHKDTLINFCVSVFFIFNYRIIFYFLVRR